MRAADWDGWSDEALDHRWEMLCRRHDRLIDSADMGDERIYFAGKEMDSIRAEQNRRRDAALADGAAMRPPVIEGENSRDEPIPSQNLPTGRDGEQ